MEEIAKDFVPLNPDKYMLICNKLGVQTSEVRWPMAIHCMISAHSNHLLSNKAVKRIDGLKLYSGPLGKTISGNIANINKKYV